METAAAPVGLEAIAQSERDGVVALTVRTRRFAQHIHIDVRGALADDDHFHLEPGGERVVRLHAARGSTVRGEVRALNGDDAARFSAVLP